MDAVALLKVAADAGLRVWPDGDLLQVRGPKRSEPVVRLLAEHKAEVMAHLYRKGDGYNWRRDVRWDRLQEPLDSVFR